MALIPYFESRSVVDFSTILLTEKEGFGGFEADRLRDRLLYTQRFRRGRGRDFIYTKNVARPRSGFYLRNEFRAAGVRFYLKTFYGACFHTNLVGRMGVVVITTSALRTLVLQTLLRPMREF